MLSFCCRYNILVVHAGLVPGVPLQQQNLTILIKLRDLQQAPDGRCEVKLFLVFESMAIRQALCPLCAALHECVV
jgi:hypothetical protein